MPRRGAPGERRPAAPSCSRRHTPLRSSTAAWCRYPTVSKPTTMTSGDAATMRSEPPIDRPVCTATTLSRERDDRRDEEPDVEPVELLHEERVQREQNDLEDEHRDGDDMSANVASTCASCEMTCAATWRPVPTPTIDPKSTMCP